MFRPLGVNIGLRYSASRRSFIGQLSALAIFGLALSIAVLLLVLSVINGFERELRERVLGVIPHVTLRARVPEAHSAQTLSQLQSLPGVAGAAGFLQGTVLLASGSEVRGATLHGIVPEEYAAVSQVARFASDEAMAALAGDGFPLLIGSGLARELGIGTGDSLSVVMPEGTVSPAGLHPRQRRFTVVGVLHTASEIDASSAFTSQRAAARMFRTGGGIHGYQLRLDDLFTAERVGRAALVTLDGEFFGSTWMRTHGNLYRAIGLQKATMFVLLSFLVAVAAFNLVSTLVMVVNERRADVAVLRTLGTGGGPIVLAFITLGLIIGCLGVVLGLLAGLGLGVLLEEGFAWLSEAFGWNLLSQYFVNYLPVDTRWQDALGVAGTALLLCFLSTLYPAWRATALLPTRILKYE